MADGLTWDYCAKCGRKIAVGEVCFDTGDDSYCSDCCKQVDTNKDWGDRFAGAVEYVPVVRCKDCKHFTAKEGYEYIGGFCNVTDVVTHGRRADAYCSMGERRDNAAD